MEIEEVTPAELASYGQVPIRFWVRERWTPTGFVPVANPWEKEYDVPGNRPQDWHLHFDLARWGFLVARFEDQVIGGTAICRDTPGVDLLEDRPDLAHVWDIRIDPQFRGEGVGRRLWQHVEAWCRAHGVSELRVESQDINAPACRFYARMGCELLSVNPGAYPELPDEIQLIWGKQLGAAPGD
ncbi:MAG: GNAT family N-acetyltransferase [Armatimonadota bacterium]|jgi:ribosomal protein S18 acetylase RimI-like enzyme